MMRSFIAASLEDWSAMVKVDSGVGFADKGRRLSEGYPEIEEIGEGQLIVRKLLLLVCNGNCCCRRRN